MRAVWLLICLMVLPALAEPHKGWIFTDRTDDDGFHQILDSQEALEAFRKSLPVRVPSKKHPAPANPDVLLNSSLVDFSRQRLLILARGETISTHPKVLSQKESKDTIVFKVELPEPPPEARPFGWGVYIAVPLPKNGKKVDVQFQDGPPRRPG